MARRAEGDTHRIAGTSLEPTQPSERPKGARGRGNDPGYGKIVWDWTIRSQAPKPKGMGKVQRLSGSGPRLLVLSEARPKI